MRRVTIAAAEPGPRFENFVERSVRPREVDDQLVRGKGVIDGIAQGRDDAAIRNVRLDAFGRERMEKVRADFRDFAIAGGVAKMMRVPIDALVVDRC